MTKNTVFLTLDKIGICIWIGDLILSSFTVFNFLFNIFVRIVFGIFVVVRRTFLWFKQYTHCYWPNKQSYSYCYSFSCPSSLLKKTITAKCALPEISLQDRVEISALSWLASFAIRQRELALPDGAGEDTWQAGGTSQACLANGCAVATS